MGYPMDPDPQHHDLLPGSVNLALHTITKQDWMAEMRRGKHIPKHPFKLIVEHFTFTEPCNTLEECTKAVYNLQKQDLENRLTDIKYNFLIGGDGNIYEGRGWHACPSKKLMKAPALYRRRLDIAYIGDYTDKNIPEAMFERKFDIIDFGVKIGLIKPTYNTLKARREDDFPPPKVENEKSKEESEKTPGQPYNPPGSLDLILHIVTREQWKSESTVGRVSNKHPIKVIVEHFTFTEQCNTPTECVKAVQDMQRDHIQQGFGDIKYNFLVGGDGHIYEGRGWHVCPSDSLLDVPNKLKRRLDIAYIGDFTGKVIPEVMVQRKNDVIDFALRMMMMKPIFVHLVATREDDFLSQPPPSLSIVGGDLEDPC